MEGEAVTSISSHLLDVSKEGIKLSEEQAQIFHHSTAKLRFLSKRAQHDIKTAFALLKGQRSRL
jgi:hypothetical protein